MLANQTTNQFANLTAFTPIADLQNILEPDFFFVLRDGFPNVSV